MKVAIVGTGMIEIPPKKGGAIESIIYDIYKHAKKEMDIKIVDKINGLDKIYLKSSSSSNKFSNMLKEFSFGLRAIKKTEYADIVHLHTVFTALPFALLKGILKPKIIYTSHNPAWTVPNKELDIGNKIAQFFEHCVMKQVDIVTAVSESARQGMIKKGKIKESKIIKITNFVDTKLFTPKNGKSWKTKHKIKNKMILFVGKLTKNKGYHLLLEAAKNIDATFVFVGPKNFETSESINIKTEKNVIFTGAVPFKELKKIYSSADMFCLPTAREAMPLVVLESIASGTPVIATNVSGIPEILTQKNGILLKDRNPETIKTAINKMIKEPLKNVEKTIKKFSKPVVLDKYVKLYKSVIA